MGPAFLRYRMMASDGDGTDQAAMKTARSPGHTVLRELYNSMFQLYRGRSLGPSDRAASR